MMGARFTFISLTMVIWFMPICTKCAYWIYSFSLLDYLLCSQAAFSNLKYYKRVFIKKRPKNLKNNKRNKMLLINMFYTFIKLYKD